MKDQESMLYVKRTQKDYSMSFKLQVVQEIERGELNLSTASLKYGIQGSHTVGRWVQKYGIFDKGNKTLFYMKKSPQQRILELEQQVKLLEKQKRILETQVENADKKKFNFGIALVRPLN